MSGLAPSTDAEIRFQRISALTVCDVCELSDTLSEAQRNMVADNGTSIAEAHFSENAWFRAIYADDTLVGFIMLHIGADHDDGIDCPGVFLWRFMIAGPFQGKGFGRKAMNLLMRDLRARGITELYTSYGVGPESPEGFYRHLGFEPTGGMYDEEFEAVLRFEIGLGGRRASAHAARAGNDCLPTSELSPHYLAIRRGAIRSTPQQELRRRPATP